MKSYLKLISILAFALLVNAGNSFSQNYIPLKHSPELFLGKWRATSSNMIYEIEFITQEIRNKKNNEFQYILGKITYKQNGVIIKQTEYNGVRSIIYGIGMKSVTKAVLNFSEEERMVWWRFEFTIDENDNNKAVWKFLRPHDDWMEMGWNKENMPDIPDNLVFRKSLDLDPGDKGGGIDHGVEGVF